MGDDVIEESLCHYVLSILTLEVIPPEEHLIDPTQHRGAWRFDIAEEQGLTHEKWSRVPTFEPNLIGQEASSTTGEYRKDPIAHYVECR